MEYTKNEDKLLAAASYVFFIPSLYIILTEKRGIKFLSFAAAQSLVLWIPYIIFLVMLRIILNLIWSLIYLPILDQLFNVLKLTLWGYAVFLGFKALQGESYRVPYASDLADQIC